MDNWIDINLEAPENNQEVVIYSHLELTIRGQKMLFEELCSALYDAETNTFIDRYHKVIGGVLLWVPLPNKPAYPIVSSAGKEVKSADEILRNEFYGEEWSELMGSLNTDVTPTVLRAMEEYANQFKSSPASTVQKDQAFLNFITTTGLSAADQNIIKGVYFKYIEQCQ